MGSPYLNSGEIIILTTNRVIADAVQYEVMLTTERIFFIDNRNTRFEPQIIPLSIIMSIQGGKTPAEDPVITLLFHPGDPGDARQPLNMIFSQSPGENRKEERDDWVRSLIQLSISLHDRESVHNTPPVREVTGLRPSIRHGIAPEKVRPLSNMVNRQKVSAIMSVIPDEITGAVEITPHAAAKTPSIEERPEPAGEEPVADHIPMRRTPPPPLPPTLPPAPPARVIIPQIIEELLPEKMTHPLPGGQEPAPAAVIDQEALFRTIPTAARFMRVTEERTPEHKQVKETAATPVIPLVNDEPEQAATVPDHESTGQKEVPEIIRALHTGAIEPVVKETSVIVKSDIKSESVYDNPVTPTVGILDSIPETASDRPDTQDDSIPDTTPESVYSNPVTQDVEIPDTIPEAANNRPVTQDEDIPDTTPESVCSNPVTRDVEIPDTIPEAANNRPVTLDEDIPDTTPESAYDSPDTSNVGIPDSVPAVKYDWSKIASYEPPESPATSAIPEINVQEPVSYPAREELFSREPVPAEAPPVRHPIPPAREIRPIRRTLTYVAVFLLVIALAGAGIVLLLPPQGPGVPDTAITPTPTIIPADTLAPEMVRPTTLPPDTTRIVTPVPSLPASPVPQEGVWIRVSSAAHYSGTLGNTGMMRQVSGTGDNFYQVFRSDQVVQVSVQKNDNSGAVLTATIYRDGTAISTRSVTSPMGSVDLLIDPRTASAPGLPDTAVIPTPTIIQAGTLAPETVQPMAVPPDTTRMVTPVPSLIASSVPQGGVWIRVSSTAHYSGTLGNTGMMRQVSGTGDNFYPVFRSDQVVQVTVQKNDNSGAMLTATIYQDGAAISSRSVTSPMGSVDLLIDPRTASAPGLTTIS
jgi:hypothetical protein